MEIEIEPEDLTKLIDGVFKNIIEKFNPCATQLIAAGKAYLKALQGLTVASNFFNETLSKIAVNAQQSLSSDVGDALFSVFNIQKEIQEQQVNVLKAFYADLLMPLETNLEKDTKIVQSEHKKFLQQHKNILESYCKAVTSLKKQRKKKNASGFTDKEMKILQNVDDEKLKLKKFCNFSFKSVVLQERKRYGFILERQCAIAKHWIVYHETGKKLFDDQLDDLIQVADTRESYNLNLNHAFTKEIEKLKNPDSVNLRKSRSMDVASVEWTSSNERDEFNQNSLPRTKSEHNLTTTDNCSGDETVLRKFEMATAIFTYEANEKNQLNFEEGDMIGLIGNSANGWQFGENLRTKMRGWFPETYIEYENMKTIVQSNERESSTRLKRNQKLEDVLNSRTFGDTVVLQSNKYLQNKPSSGLRTSPPSMMPPPVPNNTTQQYQLNSNKLYSNSMDNYNLVKRDSTLNKSKIMKPMKTDTMNKSSTAFPPPQPEIDYSDEEKSMKTELRNKNFELDISRKPGSLEGINSNVPVHKNRKDNFIKRTKSFWRSKKVDDNLTETKLWKHEDIITKKGTGKSTNKVETVPGHSQKSLQRNMNIDETTWKSQNLNKMNNNRKKRNVNNVDSKIKNNSKIRNVNSNDDDSDTTEKVLETHSFDDSVRNNVRKTVTRREILKQYCSSDSDSEKISRTSDQYDCIIIEDHLVRNSSEFQSLPSNGNNTFNRKNNNNINTSRELNYIEACGTNTISNGTLLPRTKLHKTAPINITQKNDENNSDSPQYVDGSLSKAYGPWYNLWEAQNVDIKNLNAEAFMEN